MGPIRIAALVALTACQQVLGLQPPEIAIDAFVDDDHDGVGNAADNCLEYANPDQLDNDRDGIGDACQGCIALPLRASDDDDKDMQDDTVDTCTSDADSPGSSADADGDGIPDQCDPRTGPDVRFCVMTFRDPAAGEDPRIWTDSWTLGRWTILDSAFRFSRPSAPQAAFPATATFGGPGGIAFETRVTLSGYTAPMSAGIQVRAIPGTAPIYECRVTASASNTYLQIVKNDSVLESFSLNIVAPMQVMATVRMSFNLENGQLVISCIVDPDSLPRGAISAIENTSSLVMLQPGFFADNADLAVHDFVIYELGE